jgi:hypothetical protein
MGGDFVRPGARYPEFTINRVHVATESHPNEDHL